MLDKRKHARIFKARKKTLVHSDYSILGIKLRRGQFRQVERQNVSTHYKEVALRNH